MATGLTKTALTRLLAEKLELTNKQSAAFLDLLAETAIKETKKNGVFVDVYKRQVVDALNSPIAAAQAPKRKVLFGLK